jgi:hypothetical protein
MLQPDVQSTGSRWRLRLIYMDRPAAADARFEQATTLKLVCDSIRYRGASSVDLQMREAGHKSPAPSVFEYLSFEPKPRSALAHG